jgi:hypothetical protein
MSAVELEPHFLELLGQSNVLAGIEDIDYRSPANSLSDQGHVGALLEAIVQGKEPSLPLTLETLCRWQSMIVTEEIRCGHPVDPQAIGKIRSPELPINIKLGERAAPSFTEVPGLTQAWLAGLQADLADFDDNAGPARVASVMGAQLQRFQTLVPFVVGNGRVERLLATYLAARCDRPPIVFRAAERDELAAAHRSPNAMRLFVAKKLRETVAGYGGELFRRVSGDAASARYQSDDGKVLQVEWHELLAAEAGWRE